MDILKKRSEILNFIDAGMLMQRKYLLYLINPMMPGCPKTKSMCTNQMIYILFKIMMSN